jgi:hypothetical protein
MSSPMDATPYGLPDSSVDVTGADGFTPDAGRPASGWRGLLAWSATSAPVALLLLAGLAIGPHGLNLLAPDVLSLLDPVVPIALAALGVLAGLSVRDRRLFAAAGFGAAGTMAIVSVGTATVVSGAGASLANSFWTFALASGICAASSLTLPPVDPLEPPSAATRIIGLSVIVPIVAGGFMLAWLRAGSPLGTLALMAQAGGVTLALAAAAWLLLTRVASETEERVFAVSALLLVGGVADALSLSALFGGLLAGLLWRYAGGRPRKTITRDVLFVQHPLVVLVLLVAGARTELSFLALGLGTTYLLLRVVGQLAGGILARRAAAGEAPRDLGLYLLPPGVFGVAFALNLAPIAGADGGVLLAAVVTGTIGSELVAHLWPPRSVVE